MQVTYHKIEPKHHPFKPPKYLSASARKTTEGMFAAEARLAPVAITIGTAEGRIVIYWSRGRIRQEKNGRIWTYDPKTLTVVTPSGFYRGRGTKADVLDYLVPLVGGADTVARELLMRYGPFRDFFSADQRVRIAGTVKLNRAKSEILSIDGKLIKASMYIRSADHLVTGVDVDTLSASGKVLYHDHRTYDYRFVPGISTGLFNPKPRAGQRIRSLPKSAIRLPSGMKQ